MRFVFGYAGIPFEIYDAIRTEGPIICGGSGMFVSEPLRSQGWANRYTESHANFFLKKFAELIKEDHYNDLVDTGFALIYVLHDQNSTQTFARRFFPSTLCAGIEWELDRTSQMTIRLSKNELIEELRAATQEAKRAIPLLKKEITERDNRTPLLLPVRNFSSKRLAQEIEDLQDALFEEDDKEEAVDRIVGTLERLYPMQRPAVGYRHYFVDDRNVNFSPPGTGMRRHAFARGDAGHPESCLLSGRRRLGAPYDRVFHYDCSKGHGNIRELFYGCHEDRTMQEGDPHLNISPNDNVRA